MNKLKVVFMGTPDFAVPSLVACAKNFQVVAVYTQPDRPVGRGLHVVPTPVKAKALELGITHIEQPVSLKDPDAIERLASYSPDVIVVVAYGQILKQVVLELPRLGCVNVHSSLLPRWRGAAPIQWAILSGDVESGVTTMKLVEKLDAGEVLMQKKTSILSGDNGQTLHDRLASMGAELIVPTLEGLRDGTLRGFAQDEAQVTYAKKLEKEMELLDPLCSAQELDRKIRAFTPWPGTSVWVELPSGRERLKVKKAKWLPDISKAPGQLMQVAGMLVLTTSQGAIQILEGQWDGKKTMDADSLVNGLAGRGVSLPLQLSVKS